MSKSKLLWSIGLFLVALLSLPIAYAQGSSGFVWFFFIINTIIIAIALFILQAILMPGKEPKEKTSVWIIILAIAVLIAWFYGRGGYIWQVGALGAFLSANRWYVVLGNSVIIAAALYFILGLLPGNIFSKLESTPGKIGYGILLFIVSFIISVKIGNVWVWDATILLGIKDFLFGPNGILRGRRILIFLSSWGLFSWFFVAYLKMGEGGNQYLSYFIALVIASNLASSGVSGSTIVRVGELFALIIIGSQLSEQFGEKKWIGWLIAAVLVFWVSGVLFRGDGILGWLWGDALPFAGKALGVIIFIIILGGFIVGPFMHKVWNAIFGGGTT